MIDRVKALTDLLDACKPISEFIRDLSAFGWDSEDELVQLTRKHLRSVLERYLEGQLSAEYVTSWAEIIEGRDDIGIEEESRDELISIVMELANERMNRRLSPLLATRFIQMLHD